MKNSLSKSILIIFPIVLFCVFPLAYAQQTQKELEDAQSYIGQGFLYLLSKEYDKAISHFSRALEINPRDANTYASRGLAYEKIGQHHQAISDYTKAIEIDPKDELTDGLTYFERGQVYEKIGQYDQAISDYTKAIEINPKLAVAFNSRAIAYTKKGEYDQAISDYTKALEIDPRYADAYNNRGNLYFRKGAYDQTISDCNKALEINPRNSKAYYNRALAYSYKGQHDQAISDYTKALEINPKYAEAYNGLAWLLATAKEPGIRNGEKAVEHALKACELSDWKNPNSLDTLAAAYARIGEFDNAVKWQEKALESPEYAKNKGAQQRLNLYRQRKAWPADSISDVAVAPPSPTPLPKATPSSQENEYVNPVCKWAIHYPSDWKVDGSNPSFVTIRPAIDPALVGIQCGTVDYPSLDDLVNFLLADSEGVFKQRGLTMVVVSRQPISLSNNVSGIDVILEIRPGGKSRRIHVLVDKQAFLIDAETYIEKWDMFHPYFDRMINSFTVHK